MSRQTLILTALVFSYFAIACGQPRLPHVPDPQERLERLDEALQLSDAQKDSIIVILTDSRKAMKELRDAGGERRERMGRIRSLMQEERERISAQLDEEQKAKYEEWLEEQRANRPRRGERPPRPRN